MEENLVETKKKIESILKLKGPSLPVQVARETGISSLFAGAILSELSKDNVLKISHMKVGGSPLYFLKGQEPALEKFHPYLPGKEKEAFLLLKKKKILEDKKQAPAIRVALRNLKDFSVPFLQDKEVFWRFHSITEQEVREKLEPKKTIKKTIKPKEKIVKQQELDIGLKKIEEKETIKTKTKKQKEKPEFPLKIIGLLQQNNIELIEEQEVKKKEFSAIVKVNSMLGRMNFLCIAKDKKRVTENDLRIIEQKAQTLKMPALVLFPGEINKKAIEYANSSSLLKLKKIS
jgi:hypothetical protein